MAAPSRTLPLYRSILKELSVIYKKDPNHPAYLYFKNEFRKNSVTSAKLCREQGEMEHVARTYLCLLQSTKKYEELLEMYKGRGERSTESAAAMVGLSLPEKFDPDK